tara:strand:- start:212 stop:757 length:546 start_codon:yes stop_codon:yes gene_type:complete
MKNLKNISILMLMLNAFFFTGCKKDDDTPKPSTVTTPTSNCPTGYTGTNCNTQITPDKIRITKITVTRHPALDGGTSWDLTSDADIYVELAISGTSFYTSGIYQNANSTLDYEFTNGLPLDLISPTSNYEIRLYDDDGTSADDYMGGISFVPYSNSNGFPTTLTIDGGGTVAFNLNVSYIF